MSSFVDRSHPTLVGGGLIPDEHRYREAAVRHKRLDLMNRRLDARISSLESLATQGTLVAGFGYTTLTRSQDDIGEASSSSEAFVALFAALSVGAAVWVVYLSGYAAIRARIAFLMGSDRRAAEDAIQVLRETHERARDCFDLSLSTLVLCASSLVMANLSWFSATTVIVVFLCFLVDGARFTQHVDGRLAKWTTLYSRMTANDAGRRQNASVACGRCLDQLMRTECAGRAMHWTLGWLLPNDPCVRGRTNRSEDGDGGVGGGSGRGAPGRVTFDDGDAAERGAATMPPGRAPPMERMRSPSVPGVGRMSSSPKDGMMRSWMYKTPSSLGPLRRPPSVAGHRRFFVLRRRELSIFASQDRADLSPAYTPSRVINLEDYVVENVSDKVPLTFALRPRPQPPQASTAVAAASAAAAAAPAAATANPATDDGAAAPASGRSSLGALISPRGGHAPGGHSGLSWYLRCLDAEMFAAWEQALTAACQPAEQTPPVSDSEGSDSDGDEDLDDDSEVHSESQPASGLAFLRNAMLGYRQYQIQANDGVGGWPGGFSYTPRVPSEVQMRAAV